MAVLTSGLDVLFSASWTCQLRVFSHFDQGTAILVLSLVLLLTNSQHHIAMTTKTYGGWYNLLRT